MWHGYQVLLWFNRCDNTTIIHRRCKNVRANVNTTNGSTWSYAGIELSDFNYRCGNVQEYFYNYIKHTVKKMLSAIILTGDKLFLMRNLRKFTDQDVIKHQRHVTSTSLQNWPISDLDRATPPVKLCCWIFVRENDQKDVKFSSYRITEWSYKESNVPLCSGNHFDNYRVSDIPYV